jgi:hypothetical protein
MKHLMLSHTDIMGATGIATKRLKISGNSMRKACNRLSRKSANNKESASI